MTDETPALKVLHDEYCRLIGSTLALTLDRMYWWSAWKARGFTIEDLRLVVTTIQKGIRDDRRRFGALKWSNLIQCADRFEEELSEARAMLRNAKPKRDARESVVSSMPTVRQAPAREPCTAKPISHWIEKMREAAS